MKILVIYPEYKEVITGGQIYDHYVIDRIAEKEEYQVDFLTDNMLCTNSKYLYNFAYLQKFFYAKKYDIILTNSRLYSRLLFLFFFLKLFSKTKLINIHHHFNFLGESGNKKTIHKTLELFFLRLSYVSIIPSPYIKQLFIQLLPKSKFFFVELGLKKTLTYSQSSIKTNNNLLYVGTIERRKGLIYLIRSLYLLKQKNLSFHCNIVGNIVEEDYFSELKINITKFHLENNISFCGRVNDTQLSEYYNSAFCFVFPSLLEGYGMVILEAMAYGLPVVTFNNSAMPFTVKNGENGLLVEDKNEEEFANAISKIITNIPFRENLSKGALNTYANLRTFADMDKEIDMLCKLNFIL